ncbi:hypothetical protein IH575_01450 [Candidatus Dojkabacteria bacterium]|nr:hypothetical protein [Candidatus Dojkabacteria bacterium]
MNYIQSEPKSAVSSTSTSKQSNKNLITIGAVLLLLLILAGAAILAFFMLQRSDAPATNDSSNQQQNQSQDSDSEINNQESIDSQLTKDFSGSYVKAKLPEGWSIVEYSDQSGLYATVESPTITGFSGLTGLAIYDESSRKVFSINGVDGIGGAGSCTTVGKFSDTSDDYIQTISNDALEVNGEAVYVQDLTQTSYFSFNFFGYQVRRVGGTYYFNSSDEPNVFNPLCGIAAEFVLIDDLSFTVIDSEIGNVTVNAYKLNLSEELLEDTVLEKLDRVLNGLQTI